MKLYFYVSERDAIRNALEAGMQTVDVEMAKIGKARLAHLQTQHTSGHDTVTGPTGVLSVLSVSDPTAELIRILDQAAAEAAAKETALIERREREVLRYLALPDDEKINRINNEFVARSPYYMSSPTGLISSDPRVTAEYERLVAICAERNALADAERDRVITERVRAWAGKSAEDFAALYAGRWNPKEKREVIEKYAPELMPLWDETSVLCKTLNDRGIAIPLPKYRQLTEAVERLGTDIDRARWAEDLMPIREAVDLVIDEAVKPLKDAGIELYYSGHYLYDCPEPEEYEGECDQEESAKGKLSESEYLAAKKIRDTLGPDWQYSYHKQISKRDGVVLDRTILIRCQRTVGEIEVSVDSVIG